MLGILTEKIIKFLLGSFIKWIEFSIFIGYLVLGFIICLLDLKYKLNFNLGYLKFILKYFNFFNFICKIFIFYIE